MLAIFVKNDKIFEIIVVLTPQKSLTQIAFLENIMWIWEKMNEKMFFPKCVPLGYCSPHPAFFILQMYLCIFFTLV